MTLSNHFTIALSQTYGTLIEEAGVAPEEFRSASRYGWFDFEAPASSTSNFAATCEVICNVLLPRQSAMATLSVHIPCGTTDVRLRAGVTSSCAGRDYLRRVARDLELALQLFDLFAATARARGWTVRTV